MKRTLATIATATLIAPSGSTVALAQTGSAPASESGAFSADVPMTVTGYDVQTAEANGYRIVTDRGGRQSSVPITARAKHDEEEAMADRSFADGTCGRASLTTKPIASRGGIAIATSYSLTKGRKSFGHLWKVTGQSRLGTPFTESFSGANNLDSSWSATHFRSLYGFSHGTNSLDLTNHAKLTNGGICTAKVVVNSW
ncbi:MAG: hypothetical protein JWP75_281 [Frondihabitans sp.]|nr:hypothetical protein [Frondihabitans sp.]